MKPIIGLLAEIDSDGTAKVKGTYSEAIEKSGGLPILLPYVKDGEVISQFTEICDGFVFTGGADISPLYYGEEPSAACGVIQHLRDKLELAAFERIIRTNKPILAICRGIQLLNVALGGTLYQDIPSEIPSDISHRQLEPVDSPSHSVTVVSGTPLSEIAGGAEIITANSFHHQAIKTLGRGLSVMANADDGIIEAVYADGERYIRGYQWHPERLVDKDDNNRRIFDSFIKACGCEE